MKWDKMKRKLGATLLACVTIFSIAVPSFAAEEEKVPQISQWSYQTLAEGEKYGIFPIAWYYDGYQVGITQEKLDQLIKGVESKIANLQLDKKTGEYAKATSSGQATREDVITALFNTLSQYDVAFTEGVQAVDYFVNEGLVVGTDKGLNLESVCTTEEATVLATRFIQHTYKVLDKGAKGFVWKVEDEDNTVYLLGSIHVGSPDMYPLKQDLKEAFKEADQLVVEANIFETNNQVEAFMKESMYADGTTVKDHVSKETYAKLVKVLEQVGIPANQLDIYKPWQIANSLTVIATTEAGNVESGQETAMQGVDAYFLTEAIMMGKPIVELEGLLYQGQMFNSISEPYQEKYLNATLDDILSPDEATKKETLESVNQWKQQWINGDADGFKASYTKTIQKDDEMTTMLFGVRDKGMAEKIAAMLEDEADKDYFVVVGAGHFVVDGTIIDVLKEKGYEVKSFR